MTRWREVVYHWQARWSVASHSVRTADRETSWFVTTVNRLLDDQNSAANASTAASLAPHSVLLDSPANPGIQEE
jgi:hypothetical protein